MDSLWEAGAIVQFHISLNCVCILSHLCKLVSDCSPAMIVGSLELQSWKKIQGLCRWNKSGKLRFKWCLAQEFGKGRSKLKSEMCKLMPSSSCTCLPMLLPSFLHSPASSGLCMFSFLTPLSHCIFIFHYYCLSATPHLSAQPQTPWRGNSICTVCFISTPI